ncbi:MAG: septation protein A [Alphaproteobacteria bacterium]|nr:septation protein A [Alphaproteobacteria bacterium]
MNPQMRRLALDLGPLLIFFAAFKWGGFFVATGAFMVAICVSLVLGYMIEKKISPMPLFTAVMVLIFGGLTLYLENKTFLKVKVTIIYSFFGVILLGGLLFNRLFIKYVFAQAFDLTESGWRQLTWRWGVFFFALAAVNEAVWRNTSDDVWVSFKVWGIIPLIFLFALAQTRLVIKHQAPDAADGEKNAQQ